MSEERPVCTVCGGGERIGYFGGEIVVTRYPVCRECHESGRHERWRVAAIEELRNCNIGFESEGNLAADLKTLRSYRKHDSRIQDGVCPNGCALLVWQDKQHAECPKCHFALIQSKL